MFNLKAGNQRQTKTLPFVREPASLPEYSPGWILDNCSSISRGVRGWSEMADVRGRIMKQTGLFRGAEETDRATGPPEQSGASVWALAGRGIANLRDPTLRWKLLNSEYFHSEYQMSGEFKWGTPSSVWPLWQVQHSSGLWMQSSGFNSLSGLLP